MNRGHSTLNINIIDYKIKLTMMKLSGSFLERRGKSSLSKVWMDFSRLPSQWLCKKRPCNVTTDSVGEVFIGRK